MPIDVIKVLVPTTTAFFIGIILTPIVTHYLYKYRMWKKTSVQYATDGHLATITSQLHNDEERKTPRMGGVVIWGSTLLTVALWGIISFFTRNGSTANDINFLSRNQTWLPLFTLLAGGYFGLLDDYLVCRGSGTYRGGGLSLTARLAFVAVLGAIGAYWFYVKLGMQSIDIPFFGTLGVGWVFVPIFIAIFVGIYSGGIIDGVDGLSGGVFASIYSAYAVIAFSNSQIDLSAFCAVIVGSLLAFLWFNIPPARFFSSETGTMALSTALVVVAFLSHAVFELFVIAFLLIVTSASSAIQILSKRVRSGKKVFLVAPLHNHFQAMGWPPYKVTMRYWVISAVLATIGVIIHLVG